KGFPPLRAVPAQQFTLPAAKRNPANIIHRQICQLDLHADELSTRLLALLVQPVGVDQPRAIVVDVFLDGSNEIGVGHGRYQGVPESGCFSCDFSPNSPLRSRIRQNAGFSQGATRILANAATKRGSARSVLFLLIIPEAAMKQ